VNDARARLLGLIGGYRITQMVRTAALLNLCDKLAAGPRDAADIGAEIGADPGLLHRLMRALAGAGVLEEGTDGRFSNTEMGELLRTDVPGTAAAVAVGLTQDHVWKAWSQLHRGVMEGSVPYLLANGASFWEVLGASPTRRLASTPSWWRRPKRSFLSCLMPSTSHRARPWSTSAAATAG